MQENLIDYFLVIQLDGLQIASENYKQNFGEGYVINEARYRYEKLVSLLPHRGTWRVQVIQLDLSAEPHQKIIFEMGSGHPELPPSPISTPTNANYWREDYGRLNKREARYLMQSCLPLALKLEAQGYKAPLEDDDYIHLKTFSKLLNASWVDDDEIRRAAGLSRNQVSVLATRVGLEYA